MYLVGIILKPQGVRGEVKVRYVSPDATRFYDLDHVYIEAHKYIIENIRVSGEFVFLKFIKIDTRNEAEELRNKEIFVSEDQVIKPGINEYFVHDLLGCTVFDEHGNLLGEVVDVMQQSSNDVYVVKDKKAKEYLIPAIGDVVKKVDIPGKQIVIHVMDGMLG